MFLRSDAYLKGRSLSTTMAPTKYPIATNICRRFALFNSPSLFTIDANFALIIGFCCFQIGSKNPTLPKQRALASVPSCGVVFRYSSAIAVAGTSEIATTQIPPIAKLALRWCDGWLMSAARQIQIFGPI